MDLNDEYCPPESIYYDCGLKKKLNTDVSLFADTNEYLYIILCVYKINVTGKFPFLQFLLNYNSEYKLTLPSMPLFSTFNKFNLISYSKVFLSGILEVTDYEKFIENIRFEGFYEFNKSLYLF